MLIRLIRKFILALSVLLAIALLVLWMRTRQNDLVLSSARFGTYRELRIGRSRLGVLFVSTWPKDEPARIGRVGKPSSSLFLNNPVATVTSATNENGLPLLDGSQITLMPSSSSWWPPVRSTGTATAGTSYAASGGSGVINISSSTTALITAGGTLSIQRSPTPTTAAVTAASPTNTVVIAPPMPPTASGTFTFATAKLPTTGTSTGSARPSLTITGGTLILFATYTYTRYALPIWDVVLIVLLPVWWAILVSALRWRKKRIRRKRGLCERCGYDLRGNPGGSACPECGAATSGVPAPPSGDQLLARLK